MFNPAKLAKSRSAAAVCGAVLIGAVIGSSPAYAQKLLIGCVLVKQHSGSEVKMLLDQVRATVGDREANSLHAQYVDLKNNCQSNLKASKVVHISAAMNRLLDEYGVNVKSYAVSER
jgi:hypothetical protein